MRLGDGGGQRVVQHHAGRQAFFEPLVEVLQRELCAPLVGGACLNHRTVGVGGVTKLFSEVEFLIGVAAEVVMAGKLNGGGVWCVGLNDDFSFKLTTSGPTCDLGE